MLKTPTPKAVNPFTKALLALIGGGEDPRFDVIEEGAVTTKHHSLDILIWGGNAPEMHMGWPDLLIEGKCLGSYGVCDTPRQFLTRYREALQDDRRTFVIGFTHITKDPSNAGRDGGWRWHKWGEYIGDGKPTCEYLDDEEGFTDGVYVYHVYQTDGPHLEYDRKAHEMVWKG